MKKLILILLLASLSGGAYYLYERQEQKSAARSLTLYGNIENRQTDLGFRVEGRIEEMFFEEGDIVEKGDLLAVLDETPYRTTLDQTIAEIAFKQATYNNAVTKYNRNKPLCDKAIVSKQDCDDLLNAQNEAAAALEAAKAAERYAANNLQDTKLHAPDPGIIMTRVQEPGAVVTPGQIVYTLAKTSPLWVRAYIAEPDLGNVRYGQLATITTDGKNPADGKPRRYDGYIGYISPVAEFTPKTVQTEDLRTDLVYRVRVYVNAPDGLLKQGMPVTVNIPLTATAHD